MTNMPQSKSEITLRHTIVYYTFLPIVVLVFIAVLSPIVLWPLGYISTKAAFVVPWISLLVACSYIALLGDYVIPMETYKKLRRGEWGDGEE